MAKIVLFFTITLLLACERPNPTPELTDPIYIDLLASADTAMKSADAEKKKLEGFKNTYEKALPQTGEAKTAQRRYFESERLLQRLVQENHYYILRARTRKALIRAAYIRAFNEKKPFDLEQQGSDYKTHRKMAMIPQGWDSKRRMANYSKETGFGGESAPKKEPESKKEKKEEK